MKNKRVLKMRETMMALMNLMTMKVKRNNQM
jgi:hypothetical protein